MKDLSDSERGMIVAARRAGASISETRTILGFSHPTISRVFRVAVDKNFNDKEHSGEKKADGRNRGERRVAQSPQQQKSNNTTNYSCNRCSCITKHIPTQNKMDLNLDVFSKITSRVPLVSQKNRKKRLLWT